MKDLSKWRDALCWWSETSVLLRCRFSPNLHMDSIQSKLKIPADIFCTDRQVDSEILYQKPKT